METRGWHSHLEYLSLYRTDSIVVDSNCLCTVLLNDLSFSDTFSCVKNGTPIINEFIGPLFRTYATLIGTSWHRKYLYWRYGDWGCTLSSKQLAVSSNSVTNICVFVHLCFFKGHNVFFFLSQRVFEYLGLLKMNLTHQSNRCRNKLFKGCPFWGNKRDAPFKRNLYVLDGYEYR